MLIGAALGQAMRPHWSPTNIFAPVSTPAQSIFDLSVLVLGVAAAIFVLVSALLTYSIVRYRKKRQDDGREPPQVYGSSQVELAWTITPVIIVLVLFLASARVVFGVQDAPRPRSSLEVTVVGHRYWWEYRYPGLNVVTANELHVPVGEATFLNLLSADTDHSFWVPRLAGKTDLIPNHPNQMWIEPHETGLYLGQCAQYCGTQHAKMLLRVYVQSREDFDRWIKEQGAAAHTDESSSEGRKIFESTACINCHTVAGTAANGRFGPDLTHLMSRETIASGIAANTPENLRRWIQRPDDLKPGSLMPPMQLSDQQLSAVTAYLASLR
jgi:cytochrome c oxidase subunit 2